MNRSIKSSIHFVFLALACLGAGISLSACGSNDGGKAATPPPGSTVQPFQQCQVGQVYNEQYGCLNRNSCAYGYGWVPGQGLCAPGTVVTDTALHGQSLPETFGGQIAFTNKSQFDSIFKWAGQCDTWTWSFGNAKCSYWSDLGGYLQIYKSGGTNPFITISVYSGTNGYSSYGAYKQVSTLATFYDYNNSQGMQLVSSNTNAGLRVVIDYGRFGTGQNLRAQLIYQGVQVGTANLLRTH